MKKFFYILFAIVFISSCHIEDEETPTPEEAFIKYYGELTSYEAKDIELIEENGVPAGLVVLGTKLTSNGDRDLFLLRTDLAGNFIDSVSFGFNTIVDTDENDTSDFDLNQDGIFESTSSASNDIFRGDDIPGKIFITDEFIYIIGSTSISANLPGRTISDWQQLIFSRIPLNSELNLLERGSIPIFPIASVRDDNDPNSTILDLIGKDIISLNSGGVLIVGSKEIDRGGGITDFDSYLIKVQLDNELVVDFEESIGVEGSDEDEEIIRVFEKDNGNLVLIGSGNSNSRLGENEGINGQNAFFIELDENAIPINSRYYGVDNSNEDDEAVYNETVNNAIEVPSGYVIVGTSTTSQNEDYGFAINLTSEGEHLSSESLPSASFLSGESGLQTRVMGVTQARDNDLVLVGQYPGFVANNVVKSGEALFMKVDESLIPVPGNESNFGLTDGNDEFVDAVTLPDGSIVVVGNIDFGAGTKLISIIKLNDTGNLVD